MITAVVWNRTALFTIQNCVENMIYLESNGNTDVNKPDRGKQSNKKCVQKNTSCIFFSQKQMSVHTYKWRKSESFF